MENGSTWRGKSEVLPFSADKNLGGEHLMRRRERLSPRQRTKFLQDGYLLVWGDLTQGMITDLLDVLEEEEINPSGETSKPE